MTLRGRQSFRRRNRLAATQIENVAISVIDDVVELLIS